MLAEDTLKNYFTLLIGHFKMGSILYGTRRSAQFRCRYLLQGYFKSC